MTGGVLFQSVAEMATIWDLQFRFIYFSHTHWENGEIENFVRELEKLGFSLEKTQS